MGRNKKPEIQLDRPVTFGGVSIGVETARIGVKFDRDALSIDTADEFLCGRRLTGRIYTVPKGEDPTQKHMFKGERHEVTNVFDIKKISVSPKMIGANLTFALEGVDMAELSQFASRQGRIEIYELANLADVGEDADDEDGDEEGAEQEPEEANAR